MNTKDTFLLSDCLSVNGRPFLTMEDPGPVTEYKNEILYPPAFTENEDGSIHFSLFYPNAKEVRLYLFKGEEMELVLTPNNGLWECDAVLSSGSWGVIPFADGSEAIYPGLPVTVNRNRLINFVELTDDNADILPQDEPHGSVLYEYIQSKVTGTLQRLVIYLPPSYYSCPDTEFPILYLQHGHGECETAWINGGKVNFIMDNLIAQDRAVPFIIVMCNGMLLRRTPGLAVVDYLEGFEKLLLEEVIPYVENRFRVKSGRENRMMAGLSLGSLQSSFLTLRHQDMFSGAGLFSGFVQDPLADCRIHLTDEAFSTYAASMKVYFRAIGGDDFFLPSFLSDDELLEHYGIVSDRRIYDGSHEWKVWQKAFADFAALIFR